MKKAVVLSFIIFFVFQFNSTPSFAVNKGGFFVLDGGPSGRSGVTGGSVVLDWRDFEPEEGNYQWDLIDNPNGLFVPWIAYWKNYMCTSGKWTGNSCEGVGLGLQRAPGQFLGPSVRFKLRVTEGALPLWIFGGQGAKEKALALGPNHDGKIPNSTGGTICSCINDCYFQGEPHCNPETDIVVFNVKNQVYPNSEDNTNPVWWNPIFQQKLRKTLLVLGQRIESDPRMPNGVEFVEASLGNYGEMILYTKNETGWERCNNNRTVDYPGCKCDDEAIKYGKCSHADRGINICPYSYKSNPAHFPDGVKRWLGAGYTNKKYYDAIMNILGIYVESFKKSPIALSQGSGLYSSNPLIYRPDCSAIVFDDQDHYPYSMRQHWVIPHAMEKWGSKIYLKFAGFGEGGGHGNFYRDYCPNKTRCIYESFGGIANWPSWNSWIESGDHSPLERIFQYAVDDNAYIIMMWSGDWRAISSKSPSLEQAFTDIAPKLWAKGAISPTPPPATPTPTLTPGTTLSFKKGWNMISWLTGFPTDQTASLLPDSCYAKSGNSSFWAPFVKSYGGDNSFFAAGRKYPVFCDDAASWGF